LVEREHLAAEGGAVVVPADRPHFPRTEDFQDLVRPRVIANEVARHPDALRGDAVDVREDGLERSEERRVGKEGGSGVAREQAEDGIRDPLVTGVQTCALPICSLNANISPPRAARSWFPRIARTFRARRISRTSFGHGL